MRSAFSSKSHSQACDYEVMLVMIIDHLVWLVDIPKYCLVIVYLVVFIDTSTPEGYEEEEYYPEAEEEGLEQYQNQGKLLLLARLPNPSFILLLFWQSFSFS